MDINWIDFITAFLLMGALIHLVFAYTNQSFPSLLGRSPKSNIYYSVLVATISVDLYIFQHSVSALFNNGLLLGMIDLYLCYLIFGRMLHRRLSRKVETTQSELVG